MAGPEIEIIGLKPLVKQLKALEPQLVAELKSLNKELAEDVAQEARGLVPVLTGRLQSSIRAGANQKSGTVKAGKKALPYAGPIHFGWARHNIEPNPFLYRALDNRRDAVLTAYVDGVTKIAGKVH